MAPSTSNSSTPKFTTPPPEVPNVLITFPTPHILLVTLNRPNQLNCIPRPQHFAMERLFNWYDEEPSLRCAVITGTGRAFCAGADLKEWDEKNRGGDSAGSGGGGGGRDKASNRFPPSGFGGMSNRGGLKPIIGAVNGICFGGGMEMAINCDMLVASERATFSLPEVTIGVIALAGALPRLMRTVGKQRATEMALTGKRYTARQMEAWGLVNEVVAEESGKDGKGESAVLQAALKWAGMIAGNSPDSVIVSREGLKMGWEGVSAETGVDVIIKGWYERIEKGENMLEGVASFVEKRKPVWKDSKL
ncbi:ClpP/crotonase-like domain-containing protein [Microdochium trichocladiopsis]|uniref:ClpP/crotonase-like domain-containing protein n=1 Tax=Microdochium trichocladiopsis TaxID=1682393 RepID=A0A9P9BR32_9PEZI|nr:ClpP/crotonase-like domain-containing protein [Microdochium trichocladiopsis]KAH7031578.1 ClpP/crotonase-like domain-containing protein [Microdochium trichocladiopsis]